MYTDERGQQCSSTNEEKGKILVKTFFLDKPPTSMEGTLGEMPNPICKVDPISRDQIARALKRLRLYKALGPDRIPNIVLTKCADLIKNRLWYIFMAIIEKGWYYVSRRPAHSTYLWLTHKLWASCGHALGLSDWRLISGMTVWEPRSNLGASITVRLLYADLLVAS